MHSYEIWINKWINTRITRVHLKVCSHSVIVSTHGDIEYPCSKSHRLYSIHGRITKAEWCDRVSRTLDMDRSWTRVVCLRSIPCRPRWSDEWFGCWHLGWPPRTRSRGWSWSRGCRSSAACCPIRPSGRTLWCGRGASIGASQRQTLLTWSNSMHEDAFINRLVPWALRVNFFWI